VNSQNPRQIAACVLCDQDRDPRHGYIETALDSALARARLAPADRSLAQELVYGVARWRLTLDWLITQRAPRWPRNHALIELLRIGLYQLFWMDRMADHAAVHETVETAKTLGVRAQAGFLNAVLRGFARERAATVERLADLRRSDPATGASHPRWLYERWAQRWGADAARRLMDWNNTPARVFARRNSLRADPAQLAAAWQREGVRAASVTAEWLEPQLSFELREHPPLETLPSFASGLFYVQDPSTLLAVRELGPQPGERIVDLCAAPGGKTTFIAQSIGNNGVIIACDISKPRLATLAANCRRLGVTCVHPQHGLAHSAPDTPQFDRVLVDAPCSNTGVLRRRIDARWRLTPEHLIELAAAQLELLRQALARLKPGGTLVYSTCSLEPEENEGVVARLLDSAPPGRWQLQAQRTLLPFRDSVDGAFIARLTAKGHI
jgi:16S rRNA (cytosine967-C5)-methyltransferase